MPIYEFTCAKCGRPSEVVQRVGAKPPACPHCGSKRMDRTVSRTAFHLKGGGWYADLYATPRPGEKKGAEGEVPKVPAEKPAAASQETGAGKPATPQGAATPPAAAKPEAPTRDEGAPRAASSPTRRRPASPRKRR